MALEGGAAQLLPAPLARRRALADPTAWMDQAPAPEGTIRIGLAHGSISAFGSDARTQPNLIDPARPERAGLAYLALGDWHGTKRIGPRCWYAGTPEVDDFDVEGGGHALLVDLAATGAPPAVTPLPTGRFEWRHEDDADPGEDDVDVMSARLARSTTIRRVCSSICVSKARSRSPVASGWPAPWTIWARRCASCGSTTAGCTSARRPRTWRRSRTAGSCASPLRRLRAMADDPDAPAREIAARALLRLYAEHRKLSAT